MALRTPEEQDRRGLAAAAGALGFALGGFFDGILLHQVLQWHHLLSGLSGDAFRDIRVQILADGLFHAAHYVIALVGLWMLWRHRGAAARERGATRFVGVALVGFGAWHIVDAVLVHWILGLHHIRMDENWLVWDLVFFALGVGAIALGLAMARRGAGPMAGAGGGGAVMAAMLLAAAVVASGPVAALPPPPGTAIAVDLPDGWLLPAFCFAGVSPG